MKWYLAIEAWSLTQWYLRARCKRSRRGRALFTAHVIRAANSRQRLNTGLVNRGMSSSDSSFATNITR